MKRSSETGRGGKDYEPKAPSTVLDRELKTFAEMKVAAENMKPTNFFGGCIYGWNAHRKGRSIETVTWDVRKAVPRAV
jgi:hypothetical protein